MTNKIEVPQKSYAEFEKLAWVSTKAIPAIGTKLNVKINGIGKSIVKKYFVEHGFIGLLVKPLNPPSWYISQNGADAECHVYPAECTELEVRKDNGEVNQEFYDSILKPIQKDPAW